ncbi:hypothetical protein Cfor_05673 [Coptotermes formosanus]|uniref:CHHC U11-48K-type domain-containing protein n=1 Tax=Coptotermes formosanus TaxID=36987 RepID=A0A6L2PB69_COPFO|nr:hypothetical protein Cfor_05673 [Coptotermes formosanus]
MLADDPLIQCPYNPSHMILKSRMQGHIVKCKKNYPLANKMVCPFNAIHHVDKPDYQYHISTCPDRRIIEGYKYEVKESEHGDLALAPYYQPSVPADDEDWDAETPVAAYDPIPHVEAAPIVRTLHGASKAQRKVFRLRERLRMQRLIDSDAHHSPPSTSDTQPGLAVAQDDVQPLRLPREPSEALRLLDPNMGLGRGINSHRTEEVVPGGMSSAEHCNLGFGRGTSVNTELPIPIGIGRGKPPAN